MATITDLPDELLGLIMSYLPLADKKNARLVNSHWREISYCPKVVRNIVYRVHYCKDLNNFDYKRIYFQIKILQMEREGVSRRAKRVKESETSGDDTEEELNRDESDEELNEVAGICKESDEEAQCCAEFWSKCGKSVENLTILLVDMQNRCLSKIIPNTPNLKKIALRDTDELEYFFLRRKCENPVVPRESLPQWTLPHLLRLDISLNGMTGDQFQKLVESAPLLEEANLRFYPCKSGQNLLDALELFSKRQGNKLKRFKLDSCSINDGQLATVITNLGPKMEELHLGRGPFCTHRNRTQLTDEVLETILPFLSNLKSLFLHESPAVTELTVRHIANHCEKLHTLSLQKCSRIHDISPVNSLEDLEYLDVFNCKVSNDSIRELRLIKLKKINLVYTHVTLSGFVSLAQNCPSLKDVYVNRWKQYNINIVNQYSCYLHLGSYRWIPKSIFNA